MDPTIRVIFGVFFSLLGVASITGMMITPRSDERIMYFGITAACTYLISRM
jgi:hypothetical protein